MNRYFVVYKPYMMISQFVSPHPHRLLGDLQFDFPEGTQAVGRLDEPSEGLLILTTDKKLTPLLLHPSRMHVRKYLVQVQGIVTAETVQNLTRGVDILIKKRGNYTTLPCEVKLLEEPPELPVREDNYKTYQPHSWLEFSLTEGKNRQIRKMCKGVGHRCRRLVRTSIEELDLSGMQPGDVREIERKELFGLLKLDQQ